MKIVFLISLTWVIMTPQNSTELRHKYGDPLSEVYSVRPGIVVTVTYAKNGAVCEMAIEPQRPPTPVKSQDTLLKSDVLNKIIDELAPQEQRGKHLNGTFLNMACLPRNDCAGTLESYERATIYRNGGDDAHRYAVIQWKKATCGN